MHLPALVYHHVGPPKKRCWPHLTVSPARFRSHITWLARAGYVGIRPGQWLDWRERGTALPHKPILITFDDAYADVATYALPVLESHGFGAGVFVVTRTIGGSSVWDRQDGFAAVPLLSGGQIEEWHSRGMEFGAHSRTHADLTSLSSDAIDEEVEGSADDLARLLGRRPSSFAYPYGRVNPAVREHVARRFAQAFVVQMGAGVNDLATDAHTQLRSLVKPQDTKWAVRRRALGGVPLRERLTWRR